MSKYNTLSDLNAFLEENGSAENKKVKTKEEFIEKEPKAIVKTQTIGTNNSKKQKATEYSVEDFALMLNELAKDKGVSFAEICLEVFEKGSEITQVLKGGGVLTTWVSAHKTALNVIKNNIKKIG